MSDPEQAKILAEQKKNCPFCKIIKDEIPSKKVYESDFVLAILDINPVTKGHILIMPKEHYPILPLIPESVFSEMFLVGVKIGDIAKIVFMKEGSTFFVANGGVAGQQSSHFMMHVMPRDGSEVSKMNLPKKEGDQEKLSSMHNTLKHNLSIMLHKRYDKYPLTDRDGKKLNIKAGYNKDNIISIIEKNPQLKDAIKAEPLEFKKIIPSNNQLRELFADVDVDEVIRHYIPDFDPDKRKEEETKYESSETPEEKEEHSKEAKKYPDAPQAVPEAKPPEPDPPRVPVTESGTDKDSKSESPSDEDDKKSKGSKEKGSEGADLDMISRLF